MSLFFNTDAGHRLIDNVNLVPEFIGKVTLNPTPIISNDGAENSYLAYRYSGVLPPTNGRPYMVFWTLPVSMADMWWWPQDQFGFPGSGLIYTGIDAFFAASTPAPAVLPEAYVFSLAEIEISNAPIAVRLWNTAGKLLFDSGKLHLALQQIVAGINMGETASTLALSSLPAKPAFLVPSIYRHMESYSRLAKRSDFTEWLGCYRRTGAGITSRMVEVTNDQRVSYQSLSYFEDQTYGNISGLVLPVIDASLYD
ncbi:hypothetical protein [Janthinobacterium sp. BJB401]|uniref:hypothetical protein n=1 Tax=Janthinobacterium sp. BJB401 TaxID=2745934 RepID=UPI001596115F|nr:hypothetical protein [Janthinobacterium sp. BJB401]NVI84154.1 hypothetical protein [Janthinobacterium sp. BJB401]